jgi:hypothetical protein
VSRNQRWLLGWYGRVRTQGCGDRGRAAEGRLSYNSDVRGLTASYASFSRVGRHEKTGPDTP